MGLFHRCLVCQSEKYEKYYDDATLIVYRCLNCTAVFLDESVPEVVYEDDYFDATYYKNYRPDYNPQKHPVPLFTTILQAVKRWAPPPAKMLEIGSGMGMFLHLAGQDGYQAIGVETSKFAHAFACQKMKVDTRFGPIQDLGFQEDSFDVVILNDVIEHIGTPYPLMTHLIRLVKPGGFLVLETPNEDGFINAISTLIWKASLGWLKAPFLANHNPEHRIYYNAQSISTLFKTCGLEMKAISQTSIDPGARGCGGLLTWGARVIFPLARFFKSEHKMIAVAQKPNKAVIPRKNDYLPSKGIMS